MQIFRDILSCHRKSSSGGKAASLGTNKKTKSALDSGYRAGMTHSRAAGLFWILPPEAGCGRNGLWPEDDDTGNGITKLENFPFSKGEIPLSPMSWIPGHGPG